MFKFLKEKIKDAVKSFSSNADVEEVEEEIIQERTEDISSHKQEQQDDQAQQKQQKQKQQQAEEKSQAKAKEQIREQEEQEKEETQETKEQEAKLTQQKLDEDKQKEQDILALNESKTPDSSSIKDTAEHEQTPTTISSSQTTADTEVSTVDEYEQLEKKKGFFGRLFKKSEEPKEKIKIESKEELLDEPEEEIKEDVQEEVKEVKEELASDVSIRSPDLKEDGQITSSKLSQEDDGPVQETKQSDAKDTLQPTRQATAQKKDLGRADLLSTEATDATKQKKGFFSKIKERLVKFQLTEEKFEELFWEFELALLENNMAVEVIEKIKQDMREKLTTEQITRGSVEEIIMQTLKQSLSEILDVPTYDLIEKIKTKKPFVICIVGVNGSGKTTTLAKLIALLQQQQLSMVVAAADTFRAAAIQQLEEHTTKLGVKLIKHDYHADPAAVAFDAIQHARAKQLDVVLIDTAGRLQSNSNLMDELRKVVRVNKPDLNLFIGESITGNDCVEQAVAFHEAVGIDGIILSKADIDEKGGAAISVSHVTGKPILYLGTGQTYGDLVLFDKEKILAQLGF